MYDGDYEILIYFVFTEDNGKYNFLGGGGVNLPLHVYEIYLYICNVYGVI